jgi:hypothetical protein
MSTEVVETIFAKVKTLPPEQQQEVLHFVEGLTTTDSHPGKTIWQEIRDIVQDVPKEEWEKLPRDGSANIDHYLYGAPKK